MMKFGYVLLGLGFILGAIGGIVESTRLMSCGLLLAFAGVCLVMPS